MSDVNSTESKIARLEERIEAVNKATSLQAAEYARRLDELNHAHLRAVQDRTDFVKRETLDVWKRELDLWRELVTKELAVTRGRALGWTLAMGAGATTAALIIGHVLRIFQL